MNEPLAVVDSTRIVSTRTDRDRSSSIWLVWRPHLPESWAGFRLPGSQRVRHAARDPWQDPESLSASGVPCCATCLVRAGRDALPAPGRDESQPPAALEGRDEVTLLGIALYSRIEPSPGARAVIAKLVGAVRTDCHPSTISLVYFFRFGERGGVVLWCGQAQPPPTTKISWQGRYTDNLHAVTSGAIVIFVIQCGVVQGM